MIATRKKPRDLSAELADWIRRRREELGLTKQACADRAGVPHQTWSHWENGKIRVNRLAQIADALDADLTFPLRARSR